MATNNKSAKRSVTPIRFTILRKDSTIASAQKTIETKLGLPTGSVRLIHPDGKRVRADAKIATLLSSWKWWD